MTWAGFLAGLLAATPPAAVVVFPLDARRAPEPVAKEATQALVAALDAEPRLRVVGPEVAERRAGVDLGLQARGCAFDVFCLVEVARALSGRTALVGALEAVDAQVWSVALRELDVARAKMTDTVTHEVNSLEHVAAAAAGAARRLVAPPRGTLVLDVRPRDAAVFLFGERLSPGASRPWWLGRWRYRVAAPGFEPAAGWVDIGPASPTRLEVVLRPDPLYVPPAPAPRSNEPFDLPSRSLRTGRADAGEAGREPPSRFARPAGWVAVGLGALAAGVGAGLALEARSSYAALASEPRFVRGGSLPSDLAAAERDGLRERSVAGAVIALSGLVGAAAGVAWMIFDDPEVER